MLKGKKRVRAVRVALSFTSLTRTDVFLLETETHIFQWDGAEANRLKKARAVDLISRINRNRGQRFQATLIQLEQKGREGEEEEEGAGEDNAEFWKHLGGKPEGGVRRVGEEDEQWEDNQEDSTLLLKVKEDMETELVSVKKREVLESDSCYLLDCVDELYLWTGKKTSMNYRKKALALAQKTLHSTPRAAWVESVEKMNEGGEDPLFAEKFWEWPDSFMNVMGKNMGLQMSNISSKVEQTRPSAKSMFEGAPREVEEPTEDVSKPLKMWRVAGFKLQEVEPEEHFFFFEGECFVFLYEFQESALIYFWQGNNASVKDKGTSGQLAKDLNQTVGGRAKLCRIEQGYETLHLLSLLQGCLVIYKGKQSEPPSSPLRLFHMRGSSMKESKTVECSSISSHLLNPSDVFFLLDSSSCRVYVWKGSKSNSTLRKLSSRVASLIAKEGKVSEEAIEEMEEGSESSSFWEKMGGKQEYCSYEDPKQKRVRFWICENVNKTYKCYEQSRFNQFELKDNRQAILDLFDQVIVWCGQDTSTEERKLVMELAMEYVEKSDRPFGDTREKEKCNVVNINQGEEPLRFTQHFQAWKPYNVSLEKKRKAAMHSNKTALSVLNYFGQTYSYAKLSDKDDLPLGVDPTKLEEYLDPQDFPQVFGMSKEDYFALPKWKQTALKRGTKLF